MVFSDKHSDQQSMDLLRAIIKTADKSRLDNLPPFLRVLLSTDGTVTKSLAAYFGERIEVKSLIQSSTRLNIACSDLDKAVGDEVLQRRISLVGQRSSRIYVKAESLICCERLPKPLSVALEQGEMGIGELLRDSRLETFREITGFGFRHLSVNSCAEAWRCYRVWSNKQVLMQITEHFPLKNYL